ncbi:otogelin-like protein [Prionailurus iriomotensis]
MRRWCERTETFLVEEEVTPRQEGLVPCTSLYHYQRLGWRLDLSRRGPAGLCPIYKPAWWTQAPRNPACGKEPDSDGLLPRLGGHTLHSGWPLQKPALGATALPRSSASCSQAQLMHLREAWRSAVLGLGDTAGGMAAPRPASAALADTSQGSAPSPASLQPLVGAVAQFWSQRQQPAATCTTWSGFHYRTFDGRHYHFLGRCTYLLAGAADSTWAVHLTPRGHCPQPGHCQLARVIMGPEEVLIQGKNVSVNGQLIPDGESRLLQGLSLQWQGDWLVLSGGLGVVVQLDRSGSVSVSVDYELQGQTRGLCGVYSGRPEDDFLEPGGRLAVLAATFGNSWRLPDSEPGCLDAVEAAQGCEDPVRGTEAGMEAGQLEAEAQDVCHQLLESPFRECHAQVPPAEYHQTCLFAYCSGAPAGSGRESRREAVCTTLANYAQECAKHHIHVGWRKPGFCERLCPGGQLYSDCASACPPSCSAVGEGGEGPCQEACVSGCECPPGLFWDGALCVPAARCPCYHRRQRFAPGDTVRQLCNPCVCQDGRWLCAQAQCPAECAVGGDGHYVTFDGRSFSFRGSPGCRSSLVQDFSKGQLLIVLEHGACDAGSCLHAISVSLGDTHIQLRDSGAVLVQGLCGTFTWNQQDDFLTPAGDVETSVAAFASKFRVAGEGRCPSEDSTPLPPCSTHSQRHVFAEAACAVLHGPTFQVAGLGVLLFAPVRECQGLVDRELFHLRCLAAVCGCAPGKDCLCPVLAAFARRCAREGVPSLWRTQTLCPVLCPGGQEYQECAPACGQNCGEPEDCGELGSCVAGCNCPPGLLWDPEGECVPPNLCSCQLGTQRYAPGSATMRDCNHCGQELVGDDETLENPSPTRAGNGVLQEPQSPENGPIGAGAGKGNHAHPRVSARRGASGIALLTAVAPSGPSAPMSLSMSLVPASLPVTTCVPTIPAPRTAQEAVSVPQALCCWNERCVPPELCPCRHGGQWYPPNATIQEDCNICVCQGRQWHCTSRQCRGWCQASGAPHYVTFDGLAFTFPGACEYLLVREASGQFTVSAQNLPCGASGLTCTKALTVQLQSTVVHMLRGRAVMVNGASITLPKVYTGPGLSLRRAGLFLLLATRLGFSLFWDGGTRVLVQLSPHFRGRVSGLCGDFDGDASNDLRSRQGVLEPTAELAAHSWHLNPLCPEPGELPHPCTVNAHRASWAHARCGVMLQSLFARCHAEVPPQQHYERCVHDACGCDSGGDCECLCSAIATYADECARHGLFVRWRSQELCPLQCEGGQVYEACGPICPPTCHDHGPEPGWHCQAVACVEGCFCPEGTLLHGGVCLEPASCPCESGGSFFPPGTVLQKDCGNCTCQESQWLCGSGRTRCEEPVPSCVEGEAPCQESGHCVPHGWLCDNQDDCGDGSDEEGCGEGQMSCSSGRCLPLALLCDGRDDCGDGTDEQGCPCPHDSLACADGRCLPPALLCDGHPDCPDAADEEACLGQLNCTPGEVSCVDGTCVGAILLCDGTWDCPDGADEGPGHCPFLSLPTPPAGTLPGPSAGSGETAPTPLASASPDGECAPRGWRCDREEDCADGSDERGCGWPCAPHHVPCARGPHCVSPAQLCDGVPHCPDGSDESPEACALCLSPEQLCDGISDCSQGEDELGCEGMTAPGGPNGTRVPCPEYSCPDGLCIGFQLVCDGQPDCELAGTAGPSPEEQGCGAWSPWDPWGPCSRTCGPGVQARSRRCSPPSLPVLQHCPGPEHQTQACFTAACPVDGEWTSWSPWSPCSEPCTGTMTRQRQCHPPQNGGRTCATLPGGSHTNHQTRPCPRDGCLNATCSGHLVYWPCAPCPLTCDEVSGRAVCSADQPCSSPGCWCPAGQVLGSEGQCVWPRQCPCLVDGTRYWPGQRIKASCQLCICQDGRPQRCRPDPDCAVNCGWSSWSPWAECLGPCGSQSIQWSFRSPNNPRLSGQGRQCRGIHRKARRYLHPPQGPAETFIPHLQCPGCRTEPCEGCEQRGRVRGVGERWREGPCGVCQCLHNSTVRCSPYCPLGGCPQDWVLVEGTGDSCCHCALPGGENQTILAMATPAPSPALSPQIGPRLVTYVLPPPGDPCYSPLGLAGLPRENLQLELPTQAALLEAPTRGPGYRGGSTIENTGTQQHTLPPYLQLDLMLPRNLTGIIVQEAGSLALLQFSTDGLHWHNYSDILPGILPPAKLFLKNLDEVAPTVWMFGQMVQTQHVRVWPRVPHSDTNHSTSPWVELLGCEPVGECAPRGGPCDGMKDCEDGSDEEGCVPLPADTGRVRSTAGTPTLSSTQPGQLSPQPSKRVWQMQNAGVPGEGHLYPPQGKGPVTQVPDSEAPRLSPRESVQTMTTPPTSQPEAKALRPGTTAMTELPLHPMSPVAPAGCSPGQVPCEVLGCVEREQLCDGREDCLDGSDERRCASAAPFPVPTTALPGLPASKALCSPSQLSCDSGECLPAERRCDLRPDCQDGSDEDGCVDCGLAPWSGWSSCSRSCGLGLAFQRQDLLRPPLPGGTCPSDRLRSQPCFVQACPVAGVWAVWEAWGPCSVSCGGGHRSRRRSCVDPPPKNGGAPCPGASQERAPCGLQPCTGDTDCGLGRVHISAELCQKGLVPPCPPSCLDPEANRTCSGRCLEGCRCPPGLLLHDGRCLPLSECPCLVGEEVKQPGVPFLLDNCSRCVCEKGALVCETGGCPVSCGWSAWSSWGPCDRSCGSGVRTRFRSPSNPPATSGGAPCEGNRQELQACHVECGTGDAGLDALGALVLLLQELPYPWRRPWEAQSFPALPQPRGHLLPRRGHPGGALQPPCVPRSQSIWGLWAPWSTCSAPCDGGIQIRGRSCSGSTPGDPECQGPHSQTRDCNTQPCTAQCPGDMVFRSAEQCHQDGGPCPQLCLAQDPGVECTSFCAPGCACPPGLFLHNASCLPRSRCPCQLHGQLYAPGAVARLDSCNNWTLLRAPVSPVKWCAPQSPAQVPRCPGISSVACGWSPWTPWSLCSHSCNVGIRRRFRAGTAPPAAFGGAACQGPNMEAEFCSLRPCRGPRGEWGPWSPCSVPCGGGYRNRTRGSGPHSLVDFSTCGLQPCAGPVPGVCPGGQRWLDCAQGPASCAELSVLQGAEQTCHPGCYCPPGTFLLNNVCVPSQDCPCAHGGRLYPPGSVVLRPCENCSCVSGLITNCTSWPCEEGQPAWSPWTPWSECSASCGPARRHRHRFCTRPPTAEPSILGLPSPLTLPTPLCPGSDAEEEPCLLAACDRAGGWGPWGPWSSCSRSCGGGLRSRMRACDQPPPQGLGDYCEGPRAQGEACQALPCPVTNCTTIQGAEYSPCGPPCPRSCDDLVHCVWRCQPGCYCPPGQVLSADGDFCVQPSHCGCLDLLSGERHRPGARLLRPDGCNYCTCSEGSAWWLVPMVGVDGVLPALQGPDEDPLQGLRLPRPSARGRPVSRGSRGGRGPASEGDLPQLARVPRPPRAVDAVFPAQWTEPGAHGDYGLPVMRAWGSPIGAGCVSGPPPLREAGPALGATGRVAPARTIPQNAQSVGVARVFSPVGGPVPAPVRTCLLGVCASRARRAASPAAGAPLAGCFRTASVCLLPSAAASTSLEPWWIPENQSRSAGSGLSSWESLEPGEMVTGPCDNCTCMEGVLQCQEVPSCPGPGVWGSWGPWEDCSVSCGGGEQLRSRRCARPPCPGPARQSRTCRTQVCREAGCPAGRLYRECRPGEGCPFSCAHVTRQVGCFSTGCEEGCHCPEGTFQHHLSCVQLLTSADSVAYGQLPASSRDPSECPCVLTALLLQELGAAGTDPGAHSPILGEGGQPLGPGDELGSGQTLRTGCSNCSCVHGRLSCSVGNCSKAADGFSPWGPWGPCSRSCGGLGTRTRSRQCVQASLAPGSQGCRGTRQELKYCPSPDCPGAEGSTVEPVTSLPGGWGPWSPWSPCSRTCTDPAHPARRGRARLCLANCTGGDTSQERPCNLPSCTELPLCPSPGCVAGNCSWTAWAPWEPCSRSCGVGQQRRLRAYHPPGPGGHWCPDILTAYQEHRFCSLRACPVPGGWSRWSPWSWCDRSCGGGRSLRSRSCSSPPPKNGGAPCVGERHHVRLCNPGPCESPSPVKVFGGFEGYGRPPQGPMFLWAPTWGEGWEYSFVEQGCPAGMEMVSCANRCPRRCSDLQEGVVCQDGQDGQACQPGCRCSEGFLEQDGGCVPIGHCECTDAQGHSWAPGSQHREACRTCTCRAGRLSCTAQPCPPPAHCAWSRWSAWSPCSHSCGPGGQQSRFRSTSTPTPGFPIWCPTRRWRSDEGPWAITHLLRPGPHKGPPRLAHGLQSAGRSSPRAGPALSPHAHPCACTVPASTPWGTAGCRASASSGNSCTPEGIICEDIECAVPRAWTLWSPWSECPVSCGGGNQVRTRDCVASTPHRSGAPCLGPGTQTQSCGRQPCLGLLDACSWGPWGPCSRSCGPGLASRSGSCPCPLARADPTCNSTFLHLDTRACYRGPCLGQECVWNSWSSWTRCSCRVLVQQRYRHQGPAPGGAGTGAGPPCTRLDGHFRPCPLGNCSEDSCTPPFEFQACGSPCAGLCATHLSRRLCQDLPPCQPGCYCPEGLLEQAGGCIPPEQCSCLHITGEGARVTLAPGDRLQLGCKECECRRGELKCTSQGCQGLLPLSGWSEWSPCGPCLPPGVLAPASRTALEERRSQHPAGLSPTLAPLLASEQHRHRLCLDPETGRPWAGDPDLCIAPLSQQRLCPDPRACHGGLQDLGTYVSGVLGGPGAPARCRAVGASGYAGGRQGAPLEEAAGGLGLRLRAATWSPAQGESCEAQDTVPTLDCANQCPRSCVDLWDRVQCLQGPCRPGCRCPPGQLVQDGRCVPISSCRCGLPSPNASWVVAPAEVVQLDCKNCTCTNGSLVCPRHECPVLGPWSAWSSCSAPCGGGSMGRRRSCEEGPMGAPCQAQDTEQRQECNPQPCPECPPGQVPSACAASCPRLCSHLQPGALCVQEPCRLGCGCPGVQLLHNGTCVPPAACPCTQVSLPWGLTLTLEEQARELPPGTVLTWNCTRCICEDGAFNCSPADCRECPSGEMWQQVAPGEPGPCERTCREPNATDTQGSCSAGQAPGCVCQHGHFRSQAGPCVPIDHCECWHRGRPHPWRGDRAGTRELLSHLPPRGSGGPAVPSAAYHGNQQSGNAQCCITAPEGQAASCRHLTELRNVTKGVCYLDQVEVSYCSGHCPSSISVMPEEPYLQSQCDCCSYSLDPENPVRVLHLRCPDGHAEPVVLPAIRSCQCSACQGGDFSKH